MERNESNEIMVLGHEPWAGFKKAFGIIFALSCIYLAAILFSTLPEILH